MECAIDMPFNLRFIGNTFTINSNDVAINLHYNWNGAIDFKNVPIQNCANMFQEFGHFNSPVELPNTVTNCSRMFQGTSTFNSPVTFANDSHIDNCALMFFRSGINQLPTFSENCTINIAPNMFESCFNFNKPVTIQGRVFNNPNNAYYGMFSSCNNMNSDVVVDAQNCQWLLSGCGNFNAAITFTPNVKDITGVLAQCVKFNRGVVMPNSIVSAGYLFRSCTNFNSSVQFSNNLSNADSMFQSCTNYNVVTDLPSSLVSADTMFQYCRKFNRPLTIPSTIKSMSSFLYGCNNFNSAITLPSHSNFYCAGMFAECVNFNLPVVFNSIGGTLCESFSNTFLNCVKFNYPVNIPNGVKECFGTFKGCANFNQSISLPQSILNTCNMFSGCTNFNYAVTFPSKSYTSYSIRGYSYSSFFPSVRSMFNGCVKFNSAIGTLPKFGNSDSLDEGYEYIFNGCTNFNKPITFPSAQIKGFRSIFNGCTKLNQTFDLTVTTVPYSFDDTFNGCTSQSKPIYILNDISKSAKNDIRDTWSSQAKACVVWQD